LTKYQTWSLFKDKELDLRTQREEKMILQEIESLEEKIETLISLVTQLRKEKEELIEKLRLKEAENAKLLEEIERREEERKLLKERLGNLIEKLSQI